MNPVLSVCITEFCYYKMWQNDSQWKDPCRQDCVQRLNEEKMKQLVTRWSGVQFRAPTRTHQPICRNPECEILASASKFAEEERSPWCDTWPVNKSPSKVWLVELLLASLAELLFIAPLLSRVEPFLLTETPIRLPKGRDPYGTKIHTVSSPKLIPLAVSERVQTGILIPCIQIIWFVMEKSHDLFIESVY